MIYGNDTLTTLLLAVKYAINAKDAAQKWEYNENGGALQSPNMTEAQKAVDHYGILWYTTLLSLIIPWILQLHKLHVVRVAEFQSLHVVDVITVRRPYYNHKGITLLFGKENKSVLGTHVVGDKQNGIDRLAQCILAFFSFQQVESTSQHQLSECQHELQLRMFELERLRLLHAGCADREESAKMEALKVNKQLEVCLPACYGRKT